jgi:hypothetical protein
LELDPGSSAKIRKMLDDLFSHKIHASEDLDAWERSLVTLASIFAKFNGQPFDRVAFDNELRTLAPHAARSPFRDQYSIYLSILGVGQIVREGGIWICRLSETSRRFLATAEPDVAAFCRLQLALYQRPDGRGQDYRGAGRIEHGSAEKTAELIRLGYHVCPFRLILRIFAAKAEEDGVPEDLVQVLPEEIYALANAEAIREMPAPEIGALREALRAYRGGHLPRPRIKRKTFAFLASTGLLTVERRGELSLTAYPTEAQRAVRDRQIRAIRDLADFYKGLDDANDAEALARIVGTGEWSSYFDAVKQLPPETAEIIAGRDARAQLVPTLVPVVQAEARPPHPAPVEFGVRSTRPGPFKRAELAADPEETRIKREKRNAYHDLILRRIAQKIRDMRLRPDCTDYIDLFTNVDNVREHLGSRFSTDGSYLEGQDLPYFPSALRHGVSFLFEAKSSDERIILAQARRAVGQLYEYRYRYREGILKPHVVLVLALQSQFPNFPWLREYLLRDRRIAVCWLDEGMERIVCPRECHPVLRAFVDAVE